MKKFLLYKGKQSNKFWWIDCSGDDFVVNFGKEGKIGRYQLKEFETPEQCQKEAQKLLASKIKKGYEEVTTFDFEQWVYFDDYEVGLHPKTSHPIFVQHFTSDFYFDCSDEEAPFGSDEGHDTLCELEEHFRKNTFQKFSAFPKKIIEEIWDMKYIPPIKGLDTAQLKAQLAASKNYEMLIYQSDQVIIAVAFGQIKITGTIEDELKQLALLSLNRISLLAKIKEWGDFSVINEQMVADLESFERLTKE